MEPPFVGGVVLLTECRFQGQDRQAGVGGCRLASLLPACHTCKFAVGGIFHMRPTQFTTQVNKESYVD